MIERYRTRVLLLALLGLCGPIGLDAQVRRGRANDVRSPWAPISLGARFGYDTSQNTQAIGAQVHLPILRSGRLALLTGADLVFLRGGAEKQYGAELVYVGGGQRGGLYGGGGIGYRQTSFGSGGSGRDTFFGYSIVVGVRSGTRGLFETRLEFRTLFLVDSDLRPQLATFGINFPLWRNPPAGA